MSNDLSNYGAVESFECMKCKSELLYTEPIIFARSIQEVDTLKRRWASNVGSEMAINADRSNFILYRFGRLKL